jgi:hypothetical protein
MTYHKRDELGKKLRATDGSMIRVTQILVAEQTGERSCRALVHSLGWKEFVGRSFDKMPSQKFRHNTTKFLHPKRDEALVPV